MTRLALAALAAAALAILSPVQAEAEPLVGGYTFVAVDAVRIDQAYTLWITGIQAGQQASTEVSIYLTGNNSSSQALICEKMALMAMAKPGQFRLEIGFASAGAAACKLSRVTP